MIFKVGYYQHHVHYIDEREDFPDEEIFRLERTPVIDVYIVHFPHRKSLQQSRFFVPKNWIVV